MFLNNCDRRNLTGLTQSDAEKLDLLTFIQGRNELRGLKNSVSASPTLESSTQHLNLDLGMLLIVFSSDCNCASTWSVLG